MALTLADQFFLALKNAERPVIVLAESAGVDEFCAAFALARTLTALQKTAPVITTAASPKELHFLKDLPLVAHQFPALRALTLHVNTAKAKIDELSYSTEGDDLRIHVTPLSGAWGSQDVRVETSNYRFDLVIAVGVRRLTDLGQLHTDERDFLHQTPTIVLDYSPENERFGHVQALMATASSVSEACAQLLFAYDEHFIDATCASTLLTGIVAKTRGFRSSHITQMTLETTGKLVEKGAKREEIMERLFRTRSIATLRLWGIALTRLVAQEEVGFVCTTVLREDFAKTQATTNSIEDVAEELFSTSPAARVSAIFVEHEQKTEVRIASQEPERDASILAGLFGEAIGDGRSAVVTVDLPVLEAQKSVSEKLVEALR